MKNSVEIQDEIRVLILNYIKLYDQFINKLANNVKHKCPRLEFDDIKQQIILSLFLNTKTFDMEHYVTANTYFSRVALNATHNIIKCYWQIKNKANIECISLDAYINEGDGTTQFIDLIYGEDNNEFNPENYYESQNLLNQISVVVEELLPFERTVFFYYLDGKSIEEIAAITKKTKKNIYNSLRKIKNRIKEFQDI